MSHPFIHISLVVLSLSLQAKALNPSGIPDVNDIDPKKLNHQILMNLHELREDADQIPVAQLAIEHAKEDADRALTKLQTNKALKEKQAISEFEFRESEKDSLIKTIQVEVESLKVEDRKFNFEIKRQFIEDQLGRGPSLKKTAQLLANQRKVRLEAGKLLQKKAQVELEFQNYHYRINKFLHTDNALTLDELLDVVRDRNKAAETVAGLAKYMEELQKTYEESQALADKLSK